MVVKKKKSNSKSNPQTRGTLVTPSRLKKNHTKPYPASQKLSTPFMTYHATITLTHDYPTHLYEALVNDLMQSSYDRSTLSLVAVKKKQKQLVLAVTASDAVAFRATLHGISKIAETYEKMASLIFDSPKTP